MCLLVVGTYRGVTVGPFVEACISLIVHATRLGMDPDKGLPSYNCNVTFIPSASHENHNKICRMILKNSKVTK